jgi:hypothetical protein
MPFFLYLIKTKNKKQKNMKNYILIGLGLTVAGIIAYKILWKKDEEKSNITSKNGTPISTDDLCVAKYIMAGWSYDDAVVACTDLKKSIRNPKVSSTLSTSRKFY